jgi:hypothetical protein
MSYQQQPGGWQDPSSFPAHQGQPGYPMSASSTPGLDLNPHTYKLAVASLVASLCGLLLCGFPALAGAIMGHLARKQIQQRIEETRRVVLRPVEVPLEDREAMMRILLRFLKKRNGVALAGIIIGWIGFVLWLGLFWVPFAWGFFEAAAESRSR